MQAATDLTSRVRQLNLADAALDRIGPMLAAPRARDDDEATHRSNPPTLAPSIFSSDGSHATNRLESLRRLQRDAADDED